MEGKASKCLEFGSQVEYGICLDDGSTILGMLLLQPSNHLWKGYQTQEAPSMIRLEDVMFYNMRVLALCIHSYGMDAV